MMRKLNEITDKNPFKVPENYFEDVNRRIISVTSDNTKESRRTGSYNRFRPFITIAASVTGFIILSYIALQLITLSDDKQQISETIFSENPELYLNEIDLITLEKSAAESGIYLEDSGISKNEIIDYLLLEDIEISTIYERL